MRRPIRRWKACSWRVAMSRRSTSRQRPEIRNIQNRSQPRHESNRYMIIQLHLQSFIIIYISYIYIDYLLYYTHIHIVLLYDII